MPLCGFNKKMIQGIAIFAEGLLEATLERAEEKRVDIRQAFQDEIKELGIFLEALEEKYQELKKKRTPEETMKRIVEWMDDKQ